MIYLKTLKSDDLPSFRGLMGSKDFGGCFCAVWTSYGEDWGSRCADSSQPNFLVTQRNVKEGRHVGFLVYEGDKLVGWTGSGPKTAFPFLKTKLASRQSKFSDEIWSIGCLTLAAEARGRNLSEEIVQAVAQEARLNRARLLEAYPTRPWDEPRMFRGSEGLYKRLGFTEISSEKDGETDILLMQLRLS